MNRKAVSSQWEFLNLTVKLWSGFKQRGHEQQATASSRELLPPAFRALNNIRQLARNLRQFAMGHNAFTSKDGWDHWNIHWHTSREYFLKIQEKSHLIIENWNKVFTGNPIRTWQQLRLWEELDYCQQRQVSGAEGAILNTKYWSDNLMASNISKDS